MAGQAEKNTAAPSPSRFPKMLTLVQVQEILNIGMPALRALVASGELRAVQLGGKRMWRVSEDDLAAYLDLAYEQTRARIDSGQITPDEDAADG
jgi:excisionase family DNA binding protein